ncbi:MAG: twin-arginine translocation signal domain-containing protein, partial [Lentisphaeria bacterium]|nr:twin-arginine translocation signal domain-containing protein [Lentisphaeria bacterium]
MDESISRRGFLKASAGAGVALQGLQMASSVWAQAPGARRFKAVLIGCGGRGKGAMGNCIEAAQSIGAEIRVVATADVFEDRAKGAGKQF